MHALLTDDPEGIERYWLDRFEKQAKALTGHGSRCRATTWPRSNAVGPSCDSIAPGRQRRYASRAVAAAKGCLGPGPSPAPASCLVWAQCSVISTLNGMSYDYGGPRPPTFSQARGYVEYPTAIQVKSLDERLRTDIWNYVSINYLDPRTANPIPLQQIWTDHLGELIHNYDYQTLYGQIQLAVIAGPWYGVYDLLQWLTQNTLPGYPSPSDDFNQILARNRADHRIVDRHVVAITDETELEFDHQCDRNGFDARQQSHQERTGIVRKPR